MADGFGVRRLTVNLQPAGATPGPEICALQTRICIGNTPIPFTPRCCWFWRTCWGWISICRWWRTVPPQVACDPAVSQFQCAPASPIVDPGHFMDPVDPATLKAELQMALAQAEAAEKAQAEALAPKTKEDIQSALKDLEAAGQQIAEARKDLEAKLKAGGT